jgi:hypothetical protein
MLLVHLETMILEKLQITFLSKNKATNNFINSKGFYGKEKF